jgi:hypothetical protein
VAGEAPAKPKRTTRTPRAAATPATGEASEKPKRAPRAKATSTEGDAAPKTPRPRATKKKES